jgi:hypothetical protein
MYEAGINHGSDRSTGMRDESARSMAWRLLLAALMVVALFGLMVAASGAENASRLGRKVAVMERVIDEVLVQSPNVVVSSRNATRGLVLEGYGVLFLFDSSLTRGVPFGPGGMIAFSDSDEATRWLVRPGRGSARESDGDEDHEELTLEEWREQSAKERRELIDGLKAELVETLVDYGPTLGELRDEAWVTVVAFFDSHSPFGNDAAISRLEVKAKMRDLRRYAGGNLSRQDAMAAVTATEN